jgi:tetratricopeptide (TPR) repeat protein
MKTRIVFLPLPEYLLEGSDFPFNPDIPIPIEIYDDGESEKINLENLSIEMLVCGMLYVLQNGGVKQEWMDYYSSLVLVLRPDILTKIQELKDSGLDDENFIGAHKLIQEGKIKEGMDSIRNFLERYPLVWNGWFMLGWALRLEGRYNDAQAAFRKALELGGTNSDTRNELAICLMEQGDIESARRELESALMEDPENIKIISNLGVLAARNGEKEKAEAFFRTVLEIDSNDPLAKQYLFR